MEIPRIFLTVSCVVAMEYLEVDGWDSEGQAGFLCGDGVVWTLQYFL